MAKNFVVKNRPSHRNFFDWPGKQLGYKKMDDWYNITYKDIQNYGGVGVIKTYNGSPSAALSRVYPKHNWMLWRFKTVQQGYWNKLMKDSKEISRVIDWLSKQLSIQNLDDWCRVSLKQIRKLSLHIESSHDLQTMLQTVYPQHQWNNKPFKASQREVVTAIQHLFPNQSNFCGQPLS